MKYRLPRFNEDKRRPIRDVSSLIGDCSALTVLLLLTLTSSLAAQDTSPTIAMPTIAISGQELVARSASEISQSPSLEAKVRQRVALYGQRFTGTGHYVQLRHRDGNQFRFDLRLQVGNQQTSFQHHNDGIYLWIRRDSGDAQTLSRVDLSRVRAAMKDGSAEPAAAASTGLGIGGLSQLLHGLNTHFDFNQPTTSEISSVPVWQIDGTWKRKSLTLLLPDQADAINAGESADLSRLPLQVPSHVTLILGRDAQVPLFPYRVEYSRHDAKTKQRRPMLTMELFEVRLRPELDSRQFRFQLDDEERVEDETEAHLEKLGLAEPASP